MSKLPKYLEGLTGKQKAFVLAYLRNGFNATRAAQAAGYSGDENTLGYVGWDNLRKPKVKAAIDAGMAEHVMSPQEALARLASIARGDLSDVSGEDGRPDLQKALRAGKSHLIRSVKVSTRKGEDGETEEVLDLRLHDPQRALETILKVTGVGMDEGRGELGRIAEALENLADEDSEEA